MQRSVMAEFYKAASISRSWCSSYALLSHCHALLQHLNTKGSCLLWLATTQSQRHKSRSRQDESLLLEFEWRTQDKSNNMSKHVWQSKWPRISLTHKQNLRCIFTLFSHICEEVIMNAAKQKLSVWAAAQLCWVSQLWRPDLQEE